MRNIESVYTNQELRVVPVIPGEELSVLLHHNGRLPRGVIEQHEDLESAARRIAKDRINQGFMTSVARLQPLEAEEGRIQGYAVEASTGARINLREGFAARKIPLETILKTAETNPDTYDQTDIAMIQSLKDQTYRI